MNSGHAVVPRHACALLALSLLLSTGCGEPRRPNLVLIVIDTLRSDHLQIYGYPRPTSPILESFANEAVTFERAYATSSWTAPSVASMFTGLFQPGHAVQRMFQMLPTKNVTLAERLSAAGYQTGGVVSKSIISGSYKFNQGFDQYVKKDARGHRHVSSKHITESAVGMLDAFSRSDRPFFLFAHYFDPHFDYMPYPDSQFRSDPVGRLRGGESLATLRHLEPPPTQQELQFILDLYDGEIHFTDAAIGVLLQHLHALDFYQDSLIVITADHGEEFFERGWLGHTRSLHEELIHVPLVIKLPGNKGKARRVRDPVSLVALMPTLLELLNIDPGEPALPVASFARLLRGEAQESSLPIYSEVTFKWSPDASKILNARQTSMRAIVDGHYKLMHDRINDTYALDDLSTDPGERVDLSRTSPELFASLLERLNGMSEIATPIKSIESKTKEISESERSMLEKLGYIEEN